MTYHDSINIAAIQQVWELKIPVRILYIYLLMHANSKPQDGLRKGQLNQSRRELAAGTGLSEMQIRNGLKKLQEADLITIKLEKQNRVITVYAYKHYVYQC